YLQWLSTGTADEALLENARANLFRHFSQPANLDKGTASLAGPLMIYTESYPLIRRMAELLGVGIGPESQRQASGLFGDVLRIAPAEGEGERLLEKQKLRRKIGKRLFAWIEKGHYDDIAYIAHALFARPAGPPSLLIESCWGYIPDSVVRDWLDSK